MIQKNETHQIRSRIIALTYSFRMSDFHHASC